jgi:hypothetical protein
VRWYEDAIASTRSIVSLWKLLLYIRDDDLALLITLRKRVQVR